jgi:hypothetical protein
MRVEFATEGGIAYFPGLSRPAVIDSDSLPEADAADLKRLVEAADFFEQPEQPPEPLRGAADYRQYTIAVEDGRRRHAIRLIDPISDPHLQELVSFLRRHATRQPAKDKPGESADSKQAPRRQKKQTE